ncbi:MAG: ATP-binding protein [Caldilineaceae bacterium]
MFLQRRPAITEDQLSDILRDGPSPRVAFVAAKSSRTRVAETLAAMANANGGFVLFGVSARGSVQRDNDSDSLRALADAAGLLTDPPLILPHPQSVITDNGPVVVLEIPPGLPYIYSLNGLYLTRVDAEEAEEPQDGNRQLTTNELRSLLLDRGDSGFESQLVPGATLTDLDEERVYRYLDQLSFVAVDDIPQALLARGCVGYGIAAPPPGDTDERDGKKVELLPTVAGMLLFGRNPQQFLRSAEVICVRYAGEEMGDEFVRQDIGGTLGDQIRQAEAFVVSNVRRGVKIRGLQREDTAEYPIAVVREAIVNAIAHRDYAVRGEGIRLMMFSDRLEVYSPGRLPGHVTLDNLVDERYSRNEALVSVLSDMGYIERLGYGIDRMIATMREYGMPAPTFEETPAGFKVTLQSARAEMVNSDPLSHQWDRLPLNERQQQALAYVHTNGRITNSEYQQLTPDVSAETIRRDLSDLVDKNILLRIGEKRATYYILK